MGDSIKKLPGAVGAKGQKLVESGILTVADMKEQDDDQLLTLAPALSGVSLSKLIEWRDSSAQPGTCPYEVLDYRKYTNPYEKGTGLRGKKRSAKLHL